MNPYEEFKNECASEVVRQGGDKRLNQITRKWIERANALRYSYHFEWLGRPIIQYPQDIVAMQEVIWRVQPDLIIETGIAHGGSLIFSASMLELNAACGGPIDAEVVGVDIDIRAHNKESIRAHPMCRRISMIEGSSVGESTIGQVKEKSKGKRSVLVCLDSNHTHDHVLAELEAYAPLISINSYCVVFDTIIETLPEKMHSERPWSQSDNPMTAVRRYLEVLETEGRRAEDKSKLKLIPDCHIDNKLMISVAPNGFLKRVL